MGRTEQARQLVLSAIQRVVGLQERAEAVESELLRKAATGCQHPDMARTLAESHRAIQGCESLLGRLAASAVEQERRAGGALPN